MAVVSCLSCHSGWSAIRHSCITFELLGATVGLTSFAACGPGRFHSIPDLPSAFVGDPRSSPREPKCTGEWENPAALRSALEGELREGSCCSVCLPSQHFQTCPAVSHPARREATAAVRPLLTLGPELPTQAGSRPHVPGNELLSSTFHRPWTWGLHRNPQGYYFATEADQDHRPQHEPGPT